MQTNGLASVRVKNWGKEPKTYMSTGEGWRALMRVMSKDLA